MFAKIIKLLIYLESMIKKISKLECSKEIQKLCTNPYYKHPKGCPNYGKKEGCPPKAKLADEILDLKKPVYVIYTEFDIDKHAEDLRKKHPDWSERQIYCCLYWQPKARKIQREEERKAIEKLGIEKIASEANGINLDSLMKEIGITLEWPPKKTTRLISIGGYKKE